MEEADGGTVFWMKSRTWGGRCRPSYCDFWRSGSFTRVGGATLEELRVNVRLVAATNRDIVKAIAAGDFREDLFHRLNVVQFSLPPLREQGDDDVLLLAEHFLNALQASMNKNLAGFSSAARQSSCCTAGPGNVRELRNVVERAVILETSREIQPGSLPDFHVESRLQKPGPLQPAHDEIPGRRPGEMEQELISGALE